MYYSNIKRLLRTNSNTAKGLEGEAVVRMYLKRYRYKFYNLVLPKAQIDHLLVNEKGIFVIETKNYQGIIFSAKTDGDWTQVTKTKTTFLNPLTQNEHHIKILKSYFNEYEHLFKSLVIFTKANVTLKVSFDNVIKVSDIEKYFSSLETILNSSEIIEIFNKLNEKLLKIEIKK